MGKGGGGDGGAGEARRREDERRARIAENIQAVKSQFFQRAGPTPVPGQVMGRVQTGEAYAPGTEGDDMSLPQPVYGTGVINQDEIDRVNAENEARGFLDQPTMARQEASDDLAQRVRDRFNPRFDRDITDAKRELKFALSRRSLLGGSEQASAEERLRDRIAEGREQIGQRVASAVSAKEGYDRNLMNDLLSQAQSDVSRDAILGGIGSQFQGNLERAMAQANQQSMGNMFGDVSTLFKEINDQRAIDAGLRAGAGTAFGAGIYNRNDPSAIFGRMSRSGDSSGDVTNW